MYFTQNMPSPIWLYQSMPASIDLLPLGSILLCVVHLKEKQLKQKFVNCKMRRSPKEDNPLQLGTFAHKLIFFLSILFG